MRLIKYVSKLLFEDLEGRVANNEETLVTHAGRLDQNTQNIFTANRRLTVIENNYVAEGAEVITLENGMAIKSSDGGISFYNDAGELLGTISKDGGMKNGMLGFNAAKKTDAPTYASGGNLDYGDKDCFYVGTSSEISTIKEGRYVGHILCLLSYDNHSGFFIKKDGNVKAFKADKVNIRGYAASVTLMWNGVHWICTAYNNWDDFA